MNIKKRILHTYCSALQLKLSTSAFK